MTTTVTSQPFDLNRVIDRLNGDISHALSAGDSAYAKEREIIARFLARAPGSWIPSPSVP